MKTIETYLPIFTGFYGTFFDCYCEEQEIESFNEERGTDFNYNDFIFDYKDYQNRVAEECISSIWNFLNLDNFNIDIEFIKVDSPRFYNYRNDSIDCIYKISTKDFDRLVEYCKTNLSEFKEFLEDRYNSGSGFISFFDPKPKKWLNEYLKEDSDKFEKAFAGILEFYLLNEGYSVYAMLYDVTGEMGYINFVVE